MFAIFIIFFKYTNGGFYQDGGVGENKIHLSPTKKSKIYLHVEQFLLKINCRLVERLL